MFKFVFRRLREPSTWAGLAGLATILGFPMAAPLLMKAGALAGCVGAIVLPEGTIAN